MNSTRLTLSIVCVFVSAALFCGCNLFSQKANTEKRKYVTHREAIDSLQVANFFSIEDSSAALDTTLHGIAYTTLNDDTADAVLGMWRRDLQAARDRYGARRLQADF